MLAKLKTLAIALHTDERGDMAQIVLADHFTLPVGIMTFLSDKNWRQFAAAIRKRNRQWQSDTKHWTQHITKYL